jgi:hypothetical protein
MFIYGEREEREEKGVRERGRDRQKLSHRTSRSKITEV